MDASPGLVGGRMSRRDKAPEDVLRSVGLGSEPSTNGHGPQTFTAAELLSMVLPPVRWAVPDILPEGVTFLAGKPKLGKSWMALGLCAAVASGGVALGTKPVEKGEALYLALEDNRRRLQKRVRKAILQDEGAPKELHICTEWPRTGEGGVETLDAWLGEHRDCRLVVVDTLARFKRRTTGRRSQYDEDRDSVDPLGPVAAEHRVAILLVHHLREMESDDPLDMISGSAGLTGGADNALVLKRQRGRADAFLHVDGRDIEEPTELALRWDANVASWCIVGDAEEYRTTQARAEIVRVLQDADGPLGPKDVAELLDKKTNAVKYLMWRMSKDGELNSDSKGRYTANFANRTNHQPDDSVSKVSEVSGRGEKGAEGRDRTDDPLAHRGTDKARFFTGGDS